MHLNQQLCVTTVFSMFLCTGSCLCDRNCGWHRLLLLVIKHVVLFQFYFTEKWSPLDTSQQGVFVPNLVWGFFPAWKWVFIYSHQWAIGAFQQRWWQDIKQIVCNDVIIKHNSVVSHADPSLWQKTTNTHTVLSRLFTDMKHILTHTHAHHTRFFSLRLHKRWRMCCLFFQ